MAEAEGSFEAGRDRENDDERMLAVFNMSHTPARLTLPDLGTARPLRGHALREGTLDGNVVDLPGDGPLFAALASARNTANSPPIDVATTP